MGRLTVGTINNYKTRLRKLRRILPLMPPEHEERPRVVAEIDKLTNQLGLEMTDLEAALARGPGRPRQSADVRELEKLTTKEEVLKEKLEAARKRREELLIRVEAEQPDALAESQRKLEEMMKQHETTNEPKTT
jgi:hypothetical protein